MAKLTTILLLSLTALSSVLGQLKPTPEQVAADRARNIRLPGSDLHYREIKSYIEDEPDADYIHASEEAYEAFRDIKFSIRIIWGLYSMWGIEASWPMLNMPLEKKQQYQDLYKEFNPVDFDAEKWTDWFQRCGMQAFALICKHHDGFALWHTKTRVVNRVNFADTTNLIVPSGIAYSIEDTPFKRDIVKELCDAARRKGIKIDLYFSHPDWYDADFRPYNYHPLSTPDIFANRKNYYNAHGGNSRHTYLTPERTPEETARMVARHREQIHELLTNYGEVDMMCFDQWFGKDIWPDIKQTIKLARGWSPNTLFRARGIGNYGDYFQPEQFVPKDRENTGMPWMSICLLAKIFAYDPVAEHYKDASWVIRNLIDCVAKGGSFMVCLGPDAKGNFHPRAVEELEKVGDWLRVNGRGIYETRAREEAWKSGDFHFTRSKDNKRVYAFTTVRDSLSQSATRDSLSQSATRDSLSQREAISNTVTLHIPAVTPRKGGKVYMLGYKKSLKWTADGDGINITIPAKLASNLPCEYAWGFEIEE